jgi:hypothetical protein
MRRLQAAHVTAACNGHRPETGPGTYLNNGRVVPIIEIGSCMCAVAQTVLGDERILGTMIDSPRKRSGARRLHPA